MANPHLLSLLATLAGALRLLLAGTLIGVAVMRWVAPFVARRAVNRSGQHRSVRPPMHAVPIAIAELVIGGAVLIEATIIPAGVATIVLVLLSCLAMMRDRRLGRSEERGYFGRLRVGRVTLAEMLRHSILALAAIVVLIFQPRITLLGAVLASVAGVLMLRAAARSGAGLTIQPDSQPPLGSPPVPPRSESSAPPFKWPDPPL